MIWYVPPSQSSPMPHHGVGQLRLVPVSTKPCPLSICWRDLPANSRGGWQFFQFCAISWILDLSPGFQTGPGELVLQTLVLQKNSKNCTKTIPIMIMMGVIYHLDLPAEGSVDQHCPEPCTQEKQSKYLLDKKDGKKVSNKHKWKRWIINTT